MKTPQHGSVVMYARGFAVAVLLGVITLPASAAKLEPIAVGKPQRIEVYPSTIKLGGPRQHGQLVVTGYYASGQVQDLTRAAKFAPADPSVVEVSGSVVRPKQDGKTEITVAVGGQTAKTTIEVTGQGTAEPVSFGYGLLAALSKQGCNSGACHGSPSGKGGFRLSLRAFDSELDKLTLIREAYGRRTNVLEPEQSLMLLKPMMKVSHGGGQRLRKSDAAYQVIRDWISEGCRLDPADSPKCVKIDVYPSTGRVLKRPAHTQQLSVQAHFSDGSIRDVTDLAVYTSSDEAVATVEASGMVVGHDRGETAVIIRYLEFIETSYLTFVKDIEGFAWNDPPAANYIDRHVYRKLKQLKFVPAELCTDDEFVRRVHLDVIGLLPSIAESEKFLGDESPNKRAKLIDALLERPEFAKFWALKWGDVLRISSKQIGKDAVFKYSLWLERAFANNMPYDQFASALLLASGSSNVNPPANYYRTAGDTNDVIETTAQLFLGSRLQCAKCHNHPFERWTQDNYYGMAAVFNRVQRKKSKRKGEAIIVVSRSGEVTQPRTGKQMKPWAPVVGDLDVAPDDDRREAFVRWLTKKSNPFFAKVEANRIWGSLLGRGIVDPIDDMRDSNPPSNAALLAALAKDFAESGYDRKKLMRTILLSRTYQASSRTTKLNKDDSKYFSHAQVRMLSAEQLLDAICHVMDVPQNFPGLPAGMKATQLPAPDLVKIDFLKIFGQPERQTACACERSNDSNLGQALQLFNGKLIHEKLRNGKNRFRKMIAAKKTDEEIIGQLYLAAYCRRPSAAEIQTATNHIKAKGDRVQALEDIGWAILNTNEFLFQH